jgi:hypothetical protein
MPAQVVAPAPGISLPQYAIVGTYSAPGDQFVRHVALLRDDGTLVYGASAPVWHMGPPLVADERSRAQSRSDPECEAHVVGWVSLTAEEREGMADWLAQVGKEDRPTDFRGLFDQYTVSLDPQDYWWRDERGVRQYRRFSCASFVLTAYGEGAGLPLLDLRDHSQLPPVGIEELARAYGEQVRTRPERRERIGLRADGPWQVVLAGYVMHALNRPDELIRKSAHRVSGLKEAAFP